MPFETIAEIERANRNKGGHWFDADSRRFFGARVVDEVWGGCFFISSEKRPRSDDPRGYTVRIATDDGDIHNATPIQSYPTLSRAKTAARHFANGDMWPEEIGKMLYQYREQVEMWQVQPPLFESAIVTGFPNDHQITRLRMLDSTFDRAFQALYHYWPNGPCVVLNLLTKLREYEKKAYAAAKPARPEDDDNRTLEENSVAQRAWGRAYLNEAWMIWRRDFERHARAVLGQDFAGVRDVPLPAVLAAAALSAPWTKVDGVWVLPRGERQGQVILERGAYRWEVFDTMGLREAGAANSLERAKKQAEEALRPVGFGASAALGAAPGDVDGFVRETVDAACVHAERAFERAGLTVEGKPLGARAAWPATIATRVLTHAAWVRGVVDIATPNSHVENGEWLWTAAHGGRETRQRLRAYAWFARQFARGVMGLNPIDDVGREWNQSEVERLAPHDHHWQVTEARLGLNLWRLGGNVAAEATPFVRPRRIGATHNDEARDTAAARNLIEAVLESVRARFSWPLLPADYDPPPPSQWPREDEDDTDPLPTIRQVISDVFFPDRATPAWLSGVGEQAVVSLAEDDRRGGWFTDSPLRDRIIAVIYREYGLPDPYDGNAVAEWDGVADQLSASRVDGGLGYEVQWDSYNAAVMYLTRTREGDPLDRSGRE